MKRKYFIIYLLNLFILGGLFAQNPVIDSLKTVIQKQSDDTNKVFTYIELCKNLRRSDPESALKYGNLALDLSNKINYSKGAALSLKNIGTIYWSQGNIYKANKFYQSSYEKYKEINDLTGTAYTLMNIGLCYDTQGEYGLSLTSYLEALKILEKIGDKSGIAKTNFNIGLSYYNQADTTNARNYTEKAQKLYDEIGDLSGQAKAFNNLGLIYELMAKKGNKDNKASYSKKALEYFKKTLKIMEENGDKYGIATALTNIGNSLGSEKKYEESLSNYQKAMTIQEEIGDLKGKSLSLFSIATTKYSQGKYDESLKYSFESLKIAIPNRYSDITIDCYSQISQSYLAKNNFKLAYEYQNLFIEYKDSIFNSEKLKAIADMQTKYDTEKKEQENELLTKKGELQEATVKNQRIVIFGFIGFAVLILLLAFYIYRGYRQKQKANKELEAKNSEIEAKNIDIERKNKDIEKKNKDIMDSIKYAQRIQHAILPSKEIINKLIPESFILFRPKSIVSGDFYWLTEKHGKVLFSAVDCTGHGVPGAFMSIVGSNLLKQAINEQNLSTPSEILNFLSKGVNQTLRQTSTESNVKDGMDLALCAIDREKMKLEFAGVHNPMYLVRNKEVIEFKPDKYPIGEPFHDDFKSFTNNEFDLQKGDTIYCFSDGYIDQFGGPNKKKFLSKRFREVLVNIQDMSMPEQKDELTRIFEEWIADIEQIDDVLIFGVRI